MAEYTMSINAEVVGAAVNKISVLVSDIAARNKKFLELVSDKSEAVQHKFAVLNELEKGIIAEADEINKLIETQEEIKAALKHYEELAEAADDASAFRID